MHTIVAHDLPDYQGIISLPVKAIDSNGKELVFASRVEAGDTLDLTATKIVEAVHTGSCYAGYHWINAEETMRKKIERVQTHLISHSGIYKIENTITHSCYVGQTQASFRTRWRDHIKNSKQRHYPLYEAMRKYGLENFHFSIVEIVSPNTTKSEVLEKRKEIYRTLWISM